MTICKYYQQGRCKFGDKCKFEHVDPPNGNRGRRSDPFAAPNKTDNYRNSYQNSASDPSQNRTQWPLSVIGLDTDMQKGNALVGDMSPEELRVEAYRMAPRGMANEVTQRESQLVAEHKAKEDAFYRVGKQNRGAANLNLPQAKDPFAAGASQPQGSSFGSNFGAQPHTPSASQMPFGGQSSRPSHPFGSSQQGQNTFGATTQFVAQPQPSSFGPPQHQSASFAQPSEQTGVFSQPPPQAAPHVSAVAQPLSSAEEQQFSASQFGFSKVPESAPPPQFY